jgi:hypothetical protein
MTTCTFKIYEYLKEQKVDEEPKPEKRIMFFNRIPSKEEIDKMTLHKYKLERHRDGEHNYRNYYVVSDNYYTHGKRYGISINNKVGNFSDSLEDLL